MLFVFWFVHLFVTVFFFFPFYQPKTIYFSISFPFLCLFWLSATSTSFSLTSSLKYKKTSSRVLSTGNHISLLPFSNSLPDPAMSYVILRIRVYLNGYKMLLIISFNFNIKFLVIVMCTLEYCNICATMYARRLVCMEWSL